MEPSPDPYDPRPTWRLIARLNRILPRWVWRLADWVGGRGLRLAHKPDTLPKHLGFYLDVEGPNSDLYLDRLRAALNILAEYSPTHLRWLRRSLPLLILSPLFLRLRAPYKEDYRAGALFINPNYVWRASPQQFALRLVVRGTLGRLGRRFRQSRETAIRADRRAMREAIACPRLLPEATTLVPEFEGLLDKYNRALT